jgi:hypothetical protein
MLYWPQFFFNALIDCVDTHLSGYFKETPTGFPRHLLQHFVSVGALVHADTAKSAKAASAAFFALKHDRINQCVGALGLFYRRTNRNTATVIHTVGQKYYGFASLLVAHYLVRS